MTDDVGLRLSCIQKSFVEEIHSFSMGFSKKNNVNVLLCVRVVERGIRIWICWCSPRYKVKYQDVCSYCLCVCVVLCEGDVDCFVLFDDIGFPSVFLLSFPARRTFCLKNCLGMAFFILQFIIQSMCTNLRRSVLNQSHLIQKADVYLFANMPREN